MENDYGKERTNLWYRIRSGTDDPRRDGRSELARKHTDRRFLGRPEKTVGARRDTPAAGSETRAPLGSRCTSTGRSADLRVRSGSVAERRVGLFERVWRQSSQMVLGLLRSSVRTSRDKSAAGSETRAPLIRAASRQSGARTSESAAGRTRIDESVCPNGLGSIPVRWCRGSRNQVCEHGASHLLRVRRPALLSRACSR